MCDIRSDPSHLRKCRTAPTVRAWPRQPTPTPRTSAGGAFPLPMLPPFWKAIGPALPPGAGTWSARSIAYFKGNDMTGPMLVLSAWAVVGSVVALLAAALRERRHGAALPTQVS